ncbi:MAG: hypothetical protein FWD57_01410 [Polyangiaceae bacterium]|nr:hypothetical protein [Polyangiaceae bacterium]
MCTHPVIWGCLIPGEGCVPEGAAKDGSEGCNVCVHSSPEVYTPQPGNPCTDDLLDCTTDQCNATGTCSHILKPDTCLIGGTECADAGDSDPDNECKACRPELSVDEYRDRDPGYVCVEGADDYHCTDDICDGFGACTHPVARGCLIDDDEGKACFELGDIDPLSEGCRVCSAANPNGWYPLDEGEPCDDDGLAWTVDTCDGAGTCRHIPTGQCYIEGEFFANGEVNPKNPCEECDSGTLVTNWLPRPQGTDCPTDNLGWTIDECDGFGACTHEPIDGCWIDGDRVPVGDVNPDNECQWCNPAASASNWSPRPKGTECESDGRTCTHDQCDGFGECEHPVFTGCLIGGLCIDDRASDPANDCMECNIAQANDRYSPKANGEVCEDDGVEIGACDGSGQCFELPPGKCIVDDEEFANGATNPEKPCQRCDAFMNPTGWTNRAKGAACTDDGLTCTSNSCDGFGTCDAFIITGCLIGGACVDVGAKNSSNKCEECDPAFSNTGYGPSAPGTQCQEGDLSTLNVCDGEGKCETTPKGACNIDGVWVDSGTINPAQDCQWCDPGEDSEDWSQRPAGSTCSSDGLSCTLNACSSVGNCDPVIYPAWCLIDGKCVGNHGAEIDDDGNVVDCMECNVAKSQDEYSKKPKGEICSSEDGDIKIIDTCDDGVCHHDPRIDCRIGGEDVLGGAINPANDCEWCSAGDNPGSWTLKAAGSACSSDGLPCTDDVCDADGECKHNLTGGCIIDNACVPVGPKSADEPCEICDPAKSTTQWVHSESKECNPCTEDSECPAGEECVSGECVPEPECKTGVDCPSGVCEDGVCVPKKPDCTDDDECPPNQVCVGGVCQNVTRTPECETDDQCPEGKECVNGDCKDIPSECRADSECPFGKCVDGECQSTLYVEGSGCGCRTLGAGVSSVGGVSGLLALLGLAWLRVRRGREDSC